MPYPVDLSAFAVWKFKTVEGILDGFSSCDMFTTKFSKGRDRYIIEYTPSEGTFEIRCLNDELRFPVTGPLRSLPDALRDMGVYVRRHEIEMHSNALIPFGGREPWLA